MWQSMNEAIKALVAGVAFGVVFALLKLPIPAPGTIAGILGLLGLFIGYMVISYGLQN